MSTLDIVVLVGGGIALAIALAGLAYVLYALRDEPWDKP